MEHIKMSQEILLLEDDDSLNLSVSLKLKKEGYTCLLYTSPSPRDS